jgi:hypothetical protein
MAYYVTSTIFFGFLGLIWKGSNPVNVILKMGLLGMSAWGVFLWMRAAGFIINV